jgi:hypothetical protein
MAAKKTKGPWLKFVELAIPERIKTTVWVVESRSRASLGEVKWFAPWRRYCFYPLSCILDASCLREIANFCESETKKHK